jgi:hypothetical protein
VDLHVAFEDDLRRWLAVVYERTELLTRYEERTAVESVLEKENRLLTVLIVILGVSIMLLPFVGGNAMMAALALLYAGALGSSVVTLLKIRRLEKGSARHREIRERQEMVWRGRPRLSLDERAHLIRIINLSRLAPAAPARLALGSELRDARALPGLASWPALQDAEVLMRDIPVVPDP